MKKGKFTRRKEEEGKAVGKLDVGLRVRVCVRACVCTCMCVQWREKQRETMLTAAPWWWMASGTVRLPQQNTQTHTQTNFLSHRGGFVVRHCSEFDIVQTHTYLFSGLKTNRSWSNRRSPLTLCSYCCYQDFIQKYVMIFCCYVDETYSYIIAQQMLAIKNNHFSTQT